MKRLEGPHLNQIRSWPQVHLIILMVVTLIDQF